MPLPSFVTSENVKFNGTLDNAVVLKNAAGVRSLILWDNLNAADQTLLTTFVNAYGGTTPLAADTAGKMTVDFGGAAAGATATGLSAVAAATAGVATINVGGAKIGADPTGLTTDTGVSGYQNALFSSAIAGAGATGLAADVAATAGYQVVNVGGAVTGASPTGLANNATTYTASINVDGGAHVRAISIVGSAAQTFTTLVAELNADAGGFFVAAIVAGNLRITSASTGATSTVAITDTNLFSTLTGYTSIAAAVPGAAVAVTTYTATITIDGVDKAVSVAGGVAQTFTALLSEINTDIGAAGTASIVNGALRVTSASKGANSRVSITAGTLFPALTGFTGTQMTVAGDGPSRAYHAVVVVDGVPVSVTFAGSAGSTFTSLVSELNADLGSAATASISGGNVIITSATTGVKSSVEVYDTGFLFSSLTSYAGVSTVKGTAPRVYTATITVDGVDKAIAIQGSAAQTFTTLVSEINTDLGAAATAAITGGNIVVTSATTGVASTVTALDGDLFKSVNLFNGGLTSQAGAHDLLAVATTKRTPAGSTFDQLFSIKTVGTKPAVPATVKHTLQYVYFDGTDWKYLDDDAVVNA